MNCQTCGKQMVPTSLVSEITSGMCIYYKCENCELIKQKTGVSFITGKSGRKPTVKSNDPWDNLKVGDILVQDKAECTVLGIVDELVFTSIGKLEEWGKSFFTKHWFKVNGWTIKDSTPKEEKTEKEIIEGILRVIDNISLNPNIEAEEARRAIKEQIKRIL